MCASLPLEVLVDTQSYTTASTEHNVGCKESTDVPEHSTVIRTRLPRHPSSALLCQVADLAARVLLMVFQQGSAVCSDLVSIGSRKGLKGVEGCNASRPAHAAGKAAEARVVGSPEHVARVDDTLAPFSPCVAHRMAVVAVCTRAPSVNAPPLVRQSCLCVCAGSMQH